MQLLLSRREFTRGAGLSFASVVCRPAAAAERIHDKRPNLLIIHTDEHNFRTLGCYRKLLPPEQAFVWGRKSFVETPNIDWLADNGAICTGCYASTPVCSPSRASFVTGLYPQNTNVRTNDLPMLDDVRTFGDILGDQGWVTGYAGKWHLDGAGKPQWGPQRKFGFQDNRFMFNRGHWKVLEDTPGGPRVKAVNSKGQPSYDVDGADEKSFTTDWLADKAIKFIEANRDKPFCYMVSIPDPHGPDTVRAPYDKMFDGMSFEKPPTSRKSPEGVPSWAMPAKKCGFDQSSYFGMVKCIDDNVGRIIACLKETALLEKTVVVFTSDHGDLRGEHGRHNKGVPLEASARIPFVIYHPEKIKAGTVVRQSLGTVDFLPTILPLMGVKYSEKKEGSDLSGLFTGKEQLPAPSRITFMRSTGEGQKGWLSAVTKEHKLVLSVGDDPWLIDLVKDPGELVNVWNKPEYRSVRDRLAGALAEYGRKYGDERIDNPAIKKYL